MRMRVGARTDVGRAREGNEDSYLVKETLFVVADGMGGHRGGEVASSMTIEAIGGAQLPLEGAAPALVEVVKQANRMVLERGESDRELRGMGTTITALLVEGDQAHLAQVGDSRAYRLRDGRLEMLTHDHTLVQKMVDEGRLTMAEAAAHPQRSILTRALGVEEEVSVDVFDLEIQPGDRLLLNSDGLTSMVDDPDIQAILEDEPDPQAAADRLVDAANRAGGDDNITVIVLDFVEEDAGRSTRQPPIRDTRSGQATRSTATLQADPQTPRRREPVTGFIPTPTIPPPTAPAPTPAPPPPAAPTPAPPAAPPPQPDSGTAVMPSPPPAPQAEPEAPADLAPPAKRPGRRKRLMIWAGVVVVLIAGALVGVRMYVNSQWYVGVANGNVAIYNGIPTKVLFFDLSHVDTPTNIPAKTAEQLNQWSDLAQGRTVGSKDAALALVAQIRRDISRGGTGGSP